MVTKASMEVGLISSMVGNTLKANRCSSPFLGLQVKGLKTLVLISSLAESFYSNFPVQFSLTDFKIT